MTYEQKFYQALQDLFVGAKLDGDKKSGFINLMHTKTLYFQNHIKPYLTKVVSQRIIDMLRANSRDDSDDDSDNRSIAEHTEELYNKLYGFFYRFFCESGSVYFRHLPSWQNIYTRVRQRDEKDDDASLVWRTGNVYTRVHQKDDDVSLVWRTRDLYYVKSDRIIQSMPITVLTPSSWDERHFYFDASGLPTKGNNERKSFVFIYKDSKKERAPDQTEEEEEIQRHYFDVSYSQNGNGTPMDDIMRQLRLKDKYMREDMVRRAFAAFTRQVEVDFFIHKDAKGFLREQFDLWMYQYMYGDENLFEQRRLRQLQLIQRTAYDIINFISQFEDELARIWNKPKLTRNLNYVITCDKLGKELLTRIATHSGLPAQTREWQELELVQPDFKFTEVLEALTTKQETTKTGKQKNKQPLRYLPLDTCYFKDLELAMLAELGNLDEALDGELAHSDNYQALITLGKRYEGRVQSIYIDPPFNLDSSDQFDYRTNYKNACWATLLENRLTLARGLLTEDGSMFVRCDYNGNWIVRPLLDEIFGMDNFLNEIAVSRTKEFFKSPTPSQRKLMNDFDSLMLVAKSEDTRIKRIQEKRTEEIWYEPFLPIRTNGKENETRLIEGKEYTAPKGRMWGLSQEEIDDLNKLNRIKIENNRILFWPLWKNLKNNWTDISGYSRNWQFDTENSEDLLRRAIRATTKRSNKDIVLDFFAGIGTTLAVAQKLGRKWLGVEMGKHFGTFYTNYDNEECVGIVGRMKKVLGGHQSGISSQADYKGGGAFKYYDLEQYEDTLRNMHYNSDDLMLFDLKKTPFERYVFLTDEKFARAAEVSVKKETLHINLQNLYDNIDIGESLANTLGKTIRRRAKDELVFTDGSAEKINLTKMTEEEKFALLQHLRPYLWWGDDAE